MLGRAGSISALSTPGVCFLNDPEVGTCFLPAQVAFSSKSLLSQVSLFPRLLVIT